MGNICLNDKIKKTEQEKIIIISSITDPNKLNSLLNYLDRENVVYNQHGLVNSLGIINTLILSPELIVKYNKSVREINEFIENIRNVIVSDIKIIPNFDIKLKPILNYTLPNHHKSGYNYNGLKTITMLNMMHN